MGRVSGKPGLIALVVEGLTLESVVVTSCGSEVEELLSPKVGSMGLFVVFRGISDMPDRPEAELVELPSFSGPSLVPDRSDPLVRARVDVAGWGPRNVVSLRVDSGFPGAWV